MMIRAFQIVTHFLSIVSLVVLVVTSAPLFGYAQDVAPAEEQNEAFIELSGFFDFKANSLRESGHLFGMGPFELDIESSVKEHVSGSAALVFADGVAEVGIGFVDLHFFKSSYSPSSPRGRIFVDPGYHIQIGKFDIPFGIDYLFYATPDRVTISAPLTTELVVDGGWTDIGLRMFKAHPSYNFTSYIVNGFDEGYSSGGRVGLRPFENPFSSHSIREIPLFELGYSYVYDVDADSNKEYAHNGVDLEINYSDFQLLFENVNRIHSQIDIEQRVYYTQILYAEKRMDFNVVGRYEEYREKGGDLHGKELTSRATLCLSKELFDMSLLKLEYHYYPTGTSKLSKYNEVLAMQLVLTF